MDTRKNEDEKEKAEELVKSDSVYFDVDLDDNLVDATLRLYRPKKNSLFDFFANYFCCTTRHSEDNALPDLDHSVAEPLSPSYFNEVKKK